MIVYAFTIAATVLLSCLWSALDNKCGGHWRGGFCSHVCFVISIAIPSIVSGLRYGVGTDYFATYTYDYLFYGNYGFTREEPLNDALFWFCHLISNDAQIYFFVTSVFFVAAIFVVIRFGSPYPALSVLLFFITYKYFAAMNAVRQFVAISFLMIALLFWLKSSRRYLFYPFVAIATLFHYSSLVFLVVPILSRIKLSVKSAVVLCAAPVVVLFAARPLIDYFALNVFGWGRYLDGGYTEFGASLAYTAANLAVLIFSLVVCGKKDDADYSLLVSLQAVGVGLCLSGNLIPLVGRILHVFFFSQILLIPKSLSFLSDKSTRMLCCLGIILLFSLWSCYGLISQNWDDVLPYRSAISGV